MKWLTAGCVAGLSFMALPAAAQQGFAQVKPGQEVRVTDVAGDRLAGRIDALTNEALTVEGRVLSAAQVAKIERKGDSLWNGLAIGAAIGVLLPLLPTEACSNQSDAGCIASGIVTGALLGLAFDAAHRGYTTVYRADRGKPSVRVVPKINPHTGQLAVSLSFK
jgi:hypothetical protein